MRQSSLSNHCRVGVKRGVFCQMLIGRTCPEINKKSIAYPYYVSTVQVAEGGEGDN